MKDFQTYDMNDAQTSETVDMHSSDYVLAKYFDSFLKRTGIALREGIKDIETGVLRTMAFASPPAPWYYSLNQPYELANFLAAYGQVVRAEDIRMLHAIKNLISRPNVIYEMIYCIASFIFSNIPERTKKSLLDRRSELEEKVTDIIAKQGMKAAAKIALIEVIVKFLSAELSKSPEVMLMSRKLVGKYLTAFQIYAYFDKASASANNLRRENNIIYNMLYSQGVEMLYFIVEKKLDPLIRISKSNDSTNANALLYALSDVFYKG